MPDKKMHVMVCDACESTGRVDKQVCSVCEGYGIGAWHEGYFVYWRYPISLALLWQERLEKSVTYVITITLVLFGILGLLSGIFYYFVIISSGFFTVADVLFWRKVNPLLLIFWLSLAGDMFWFYRRQRELQKQKNVPRKVFAELDYTPLPPADWRAVHQLRRNQKINVREVLHEEAVDAIRDAWGYSRKHSAVHTKPLHLLISVLANKKTSTIFSRLGISPKILSKKIKSALKRVPRGKRLHTYSPEFKKALFRAYVHAFEYNLPLVTVPNLLVGIASQKTYAFDVLYDLEIDEQKLDNVVAWLLINERLQKRSELYAQRAQFRAKGGMDRAMTAVATPFLNKFSKDLTQAARVGALEATVARDDEINEIFRIIASGVQNVLLIGPLGVGTSSIINGIAQQMVAEDVPPVLRDKRLVSLNISALVAGAGATGEIEQRLQIIAHEIARAGNIILFVDQIHTMIGVSSTGGGSLDISEQLAQFMSQRFFLAFATTTPQAYRRKIEQSSLVSAFTNVRINEMDTNQAIRVLEAKVGVIEYRHGIYFSYNALERAVNLSSHYIHDSYLPQKAVKIIEEVAVFAKNKKGKGGIVDEEDVAFIISNKVGIPMTRITQTEREKLLNLEEAIHKRVVGQEEAVKAVASALRRARTELRDQGRPIANFLFLGSTGVGKTELSKTVADVYFGDEDTMIRMDMSEYQEKSSIDRLIGVPGSGEGGYLTEAVRKNPYSLVLLDELEKAHKDILNIFLQVMDDGHVTDVVGRKIDFTNTIIIATSNAGTQYIQDALEAGKSHEVIKRQLMNEELRTYYRPEFLNRFDSIVVFTPLSIEDIEKITVLMLRKVQNRLEKKGIVLQVSDEAVKELAQSGFDPLFGARPLRRAIQEQVDDALSKYLLTGKIGRRDVVVLEKGGELRVEKAEEL